VFPGFRRIHVKKLVPERIKSFDLFPSANLLQALHQTVLLANPGKTVPRKKEKQYYSESGHVQMHSFRIDTNMWF
jgi:hypothetical protein